MILKRTYRNRIDVCGLDTSDSKLNKAVEVLENGDGLSSLIK